MFAKHARRRHSFSSVEKPCTPPTPTSLQDFYGFPRERALSTSELADPGVDGASGWVGGCTIGSVSSRKKHVLFSYLLFLLGGNRFARSEGESLSSPDILPRECHGVPRWKPTYKELDVWRLM